MAKIVFENVTKKFGKVIAVDDFNLTIDDGEFLSLVGPSGCGKSTTLNLLAGLEDATNGIIYIDGEVANIIPPGERDIAMVFQSYALYPHMDVFNNISFGLMARKVEKAEIDKKVKEAARILEIEDLMKRKPRELSGGQRQRVALGRALVRDPKVFLLDEPLSNLDAKLRIQMRAELRLLFKRLKRTVVYVTHDQAEALTLSDRLVIMKDGQIQQIGKPDEVYDFPANVFVAGFLGSPAMNFIKSRLDVEGGRSFIKAPGLKIELTNNQRSKIDKVASSEELTIGIRPEDILVNRNECDMSCGIELIENMGSGSIVYFNIGDERVLATTERIHTNEKECAIGFNLEKIHVFDKKTEVAAF